jgi:hypothetical protein
VLDPDATRAAREPWYSERRWTPLAPLTGALAVLLWIIAVLIIEAGTDTPDEDAGPQAIADYFNEESGAIVTGGFFFMLGSAVFLWFVATLASRLRAGEGGEGRLASVVLASGIAIALMGMATFAPQIGGAFVAEEYAGGVDAGSAQAFWAAGDGFFAAGIASVFVFYLANAIAGLRTRFIPVWLAWASLALAILALIPWVGWATLIWALPIWILIASLWLFLRSRAGIAPPGARPTSA